MGFHTTLLILSPSRHPDAPPKAIVWRPSEVINIGYSFRIPMLEAPQKSVISDRAHSKERAGIVLFNCLYRELCRHIREYKTADVFAPPILQAPQEGEGGFPIDFKYKEKQLANLPQEGACIMPLEERHGKNFPRWHTVNEHNRSLVAACADPKQALKHHNVIMCSPLLWVPAKRLVRWLDAFGKDTAAHKQLLYDREAKARVESWHGMIRCYAKIDARALFVFEEITWP